MTAGVPCQSWSIAGKRLGFDDSRGQLWNDTIFLLKESKPKAFIFENVKGLADNRNKEALEYILKSIEESGYHYKYDVLNSIDYDVPQSRERLFIVGFLDKEYCDKFEFPNKIHSDKRLCNYINIELNFDSSNAIDILNGEKDYLSLVDIRSGDMTLSSWDINECTEFEKEICQTIRINRRRKKYNPGPLDASPMYYLDLKALLPNLSKHNLDTLVEEKILKVVDEVYVRAYIGDSQLTEDEHIVFCTSDTISTKNLKSLDINYEDALNSLINKGKLSLINTGYEFINSKVSSGINGIYRVFSPLSKSYPTLVSSGSNDYITNDIIDFNTIEEYKNYLIECVRTGNIRKITKEDACLIQGFPYDYKLPEKYNKWMKQIGNSVSVPLIELIVKSIIDTEVFK